MKIGILGGLEVVGDDGAPIVLPTQKLRSLVALLALDVDRVVSLDRIIDQLWGDEPPATATGTLQAYVSHARRLLEPDRRPREPARVLVTEPPGYVLRVAPENVDAVRFQELVHRCEQLLASGDARQADTTIAEALGLWRGSPLADLAGEAFIVPEVTRLTELKAFAGECRVEAWLLLGRHAAAAAELERLVDEFPLRERLWSLWMIALYRSGRPAEALRAYQRCRRTLDDELGLEPGPELRRLEQAILVHEPIPELRAPLSAAPASVGAAVEPSAPQPGTAEPAPPGGMPLVGREAQLRRLLERVDEARAGRGGVVLVEGEPGIGKTRLIEELSEQAERRGMTVAWSRCAETAGAPPFWPWAQILRSLGVRGEVQAGVASPEGETDTMASVLRAAVQADPGAADDPAAARFRLYQEVTGQILRLARQRPLLVVIDDLHWADTSSQQLLQFLAGECRGAALLVVGTFRTAGDGAAGLKDLLGALARERNTERIGLRGLTVTDVGHFLQLTPSASDPDVGLAGALHERTDGNPFFLIELVRLLTSEQAMGHLASGDASAVEVPASVLDVIHRRVARLPEDTQTVLRLASVIGREFDLDHLSAASGLDAERLLGLLEPPLAIDLVLEAPDGRSYRFSHALLAEALYGSLSPLQRARIHRRVAEALELILSQGHSARLEARVGELAHHYLAALPTGTAGQAIGYSCRAAKNAERNLAHDEAVRHWEHALRAVDPVAPDCREQRYEILLGLSQAQRRIGEVVAAREALEEAISIASALDDTRRAARAAVVFGGVTLWNWRAYGEFDVEMMLLLEGLLARGGPDDIALRSQIQGTLAVELYYTDRRERREGCAREAVELARQVGDAALLGRVLNNLYIALWTPDREAERRAATEESLALVGSGLPRETEVIARLHRMWSLFRGGELEAYDADLGICERLSAELRIPELRGQVLHGKTGRAILAGEWAEAERLAAEAMERLPPTSVWGALWCRMVQLFTMRREQGRLDELLPEMLALCDEPGGEPIRPTAVLTLATLGRQDEALARIERWGASRPFDWTWDFLSAQWAEVSILVGTPDPGGLYEDLLSRADQVVVAGTGVTTWGSTQVILGLLARRLGRFDGALRHLTSAVDHNRRLGARPFEARARYHLARLLVDRPELSDANGLDVLEPAMEIARQLDMQALEADITALATAGPASAGRPQTR